MRSKKYIGKYTSASGNGFERYFLPVGRDRVRGALLDVNDVI